MNDNPFSLVYAALWDMVDSNVHISHIIQDGNKIRLDSQSENPLKKTVASNADFPELMLFPASMNVIPYASSNMTRLERNYNWMISTGEQRIFDVSSIEWQLLIAHIDCENILRQLEFNRRKFVYNVALNTATHGMGDPLERRISIEGWTCIFAVTVHFQFERASLKV